MDLWKFLFRKSSIDCFRFKSYFEKFDALVVKKEIKDESAEFVFWIYEMSKETKDLFEAGGLLSLLFL